MSPSARPRERIVTDRLVLERARPAHAEDVFEAYARDPEVTRLLLWTPHATVEETRAFLEEKEEEWEAGEGFRWAIRERDGPGPVVGMIGIHPGGGLDQLGFVLARERWGRGYVTEALRAVLAEASGRLGMPEVRATVHPENHGSMRVMEKAGMRRSGFAARHHVLPNLGPEPVGCYCYRYRPENGQAPSSQTQANDDGEESTR